MRDVTAPPGKPMEKYGMSWKVVKAPSNQTMPEA